MELINGRYKIQSIVNEGMYNESYIVNDLWRDQKKKFLTLYMPRKHNEVIECFVNNFMKFKNINHNNILNCQSFNIIETINLKKNDIPMYYMISEYIKGETLDKLVYKLDFKTRLIILLDLMKIINYLHYRGINYKVLNPFNVFLDKNHKVKLRDLASVKDIYIRSLYDDMEENFMDPKIIIDPDRESTNVDFYSLGIMMKYLFFNKSYDMHKDVDYSLDSFKDNLDKDKKISLINIIYDLTENNKSKDSDLLIHMESIIEKFKLDYKLDLLSERNHLFYKNQIKGRQKELKEIMNIDDLLDIGLNQKKLIIIKGKNGVGKSRFLREIGFRFRIRGKKICKLNIDGEDHLGIVSINNLLKETVKFASNEILYKYKDDFHFNPSFYSSSETNPENNLQINREFKLYNRLRSYLAELSIDDKIYIIIDNIDKSSEKFISIIDYLVSSLENKNIIFILSISSENLNKNDFLNNKINEYLNNKEAHLLELDYIDKKDFRKAIKDVLGTEKLDNYIMENIYKDSKGNLKKSVNLIKKLYNGCKLFINNLGQWELVKDELIKTQNNIFSNNDLELQLKRIDIKAFEVFKLMSTFNNILEKDIIARILKFDKKEIDKSINILIKEDIIEKKIEDIKSSYIVSNSELKESMYLQIDENEKKYLHKKASEILYDLYTKNPSLYLEELLNHLFHSNQKQLYIDTIMEYLSTQENHYSEEAIYLLETAEETAEIINSKEKFKILESLIEIHLLKGNIKRVEYYLEKLYLNSKKENNIKGLIKSNHYKGEVYLNYNKLSEVKNIIKEIENLIIKLDQREDEQLRLYIIKTKYNIAMNKLDLIQKDLDNAVDLCEKSNSILCKGIFYNLKGIYEYLSNNPKLASQDFKTSIDYFNQAKDSIRVLKPINNMGNVLSNWLGDYEEAIKYFNRGYDIADKYEIARELSIFLNNIGEVHLCKFEYEKSIDQFEKSIKVLEQLQELKGIFIAKSNLGIAYLQIGENSKASEIYLELKDLYNEEEIYDSEMLISYYKFLSIFHGELGNWEDAIKYSKQVSSISKKNNHKEHLNSKFTTIYYKYCLNDSLDKEEINKLLKEYENTNYIYDRYKAILIFSVLAAIEKENLFSVELFLKYKNENNNLKVPMFDFFIELSKVILNPNEENMIKLEGKLDCNNIDLNNVKLKSYIILGQKWFELGKYMEAINHFLESLNLIFKAINSIKDKDLKFIYIENHNGDLIKEYLYRSIKLQFNKSIEYKKLRDLREFEFDSYFEFNNIFENLNDKEFNSLISVNDKKENIKTLEKLLSKMGEEYKENLKSILLYIKKETLANRGFIIFQDLKSGEYIDIASIIKGDRYNKKSGILNLSNRSSMGILLNKTFSNMKESKYIEYLSNDLVGLICVPITISSSSSNLNRRKKDNHLNQDYKAYIYLETNSFLNRFDFKRLKLINSLSYLVHVNIQNNRLKLANTTDKLTKVLTRKEFEVKLEESLNKHGKMDSSFSLLMIDIDDFKDINDTYGHIKGDEVLAEVGKKLKSSVRSTDLVGRYGGEEFILALLNTNIQDGRKVAEKIRRTIENIQIPGVNKNITVSIGLSQYPEHSQFKKILINKADQALYQAKENAHKNNVIVWNHKLDKNLGKSNRLEGILFGNSNLEFKNMNAILDILDLNTKRKPLAYKAKRFLEILNNCIDSMDSTLFIVGKDFEYKKFLCRGEDTLDKNFRNNYNYNIIDKVVKNKSGEFLIDWENTYSIDSISGMPNWKSIMVVPLIVKEEVKAVVYSRVLLKEKEFDNSSLNICKLLSNAFSPNLEYCEEGKYDSHNQRCSKASKSFYIHSFESNK